LSIDLQTEFYVQIKFGFKMNYNALSNFKDKAIPLDPSVYMSD